MHQPYFKNPQDIWDLLIKGLPFTINNLPFTKNILPFIKNIVRNDFFPVFEGLVSKKKTQMVIPFWGCHTGT